MSAGTADHLITKLSPFTSSNTKTNAFTRMMRMVINGTCTGRRDASLNGIKPPTSSSSVRSPVGVLQGKPEHCTPDFPQVAGGFDPLLFNSLLLQAGGFENWKRSAQH